MLPVGNGSLLADCLLRLRRFGRRTVDTFVATLGFAIGATVFGCCFACSAMLVSLIPLADWHESHGSTLITPRASPISSVVRESEHVCPTKNN